MMYGARNTHEVAQSAAPESRVVYVDNDPLVLSHARALLTSSPEGVTAYLDADLRNTDQILEQAAGTLDFGQPVGVMLLAILHYIPELDEARRIVAGLLSAVPSGSYLTISHAASDISPEAMAEMIRRMNQHLAEGNHVGRTREVVAGFFDGLDLLDPGVVKVTEWRPESEIEAGGPTSLWAASPASHNAPGPGSRCFMIVNSFGRYLARTVHDHGPSAPAPGHEAWMSRAAAHRGQTGGGSPWKK
jgi:hypothetical protein